MKNLNIALLHYSCPPIVGGVEEVLSQQASLFYRYCNNVKILAGAGERFTTQFSVEINPLLGSRNKRILDAHKLAHEKNLSPVETLSDQIYRYLSKALQDFDILIAHNVLSMHYNLPLTMALSRLSEDNLLPVIGWNHDSPYFYPDYPDYLDRYPWNIIKQPLTNIHYVVISEGRKLQFEKLYGGDDKIIVLPNGIDPVDFFCLDPATLRLIKEQDLFKRDMLMIQPCRLHPRKNIELSIRVINAFQKQNLHASLLVTGPYDPHEPKGVEYYKRLRTLSLELGVDQDVLFMAEYTFQNGERLTRWKNIARDLYLIADLLFLPSWQEGFGLPILEAGVIKLPVVCSRIAPFEETGREDVCFFELTDSPEEVADKILNFLNNLKPNRLFRRVINEYAWDNIYQTRLLPFLRSVIRQ